MLRKLSREPNSFKFIRCCRPTRFAGAAPLPLDRYPSLLEWRNPVQVEMGSCGRARWNLLVLPRVIIVMHSWTTHRRRKGRSGRSPLDIDVRNRSDLSRMLVRRAVASRSQRQVIRRWETGKLISRCLNVTIILPASTKDLHFSDDIRVLREVS